MPLDELLAAEGLEGRIDEVVAWARARADEILAAEGLDDELAEVLRGDGNGVGARGPATADDPRGVPELRTDAGHTQPGVPLPPTPGDGGSRAPLPPVPQRPEPESTRGDDELEMLDEDDLELVEDLGGDDEGEGESGDAGDAGDAGDVAASGNGAGEHAGDGATEGEPEGDAGERVSPLGVSDSSPEWKRALEDAQSD